jgi:hypothetical protein
MRIDYLDSVQLHIREYVEGQEARVLRANLDSNQDGTITEAEVEGYNRFMEEKLSGQYATSDMTLDGVGHESIFFSITHYDAEGPVESNATIIFKIRKDVYFAEPRDDSLHTYGFGSEAIGGDEPWENRLDSVFLASAPSKWKFDTRDWPEDLKQFLSRGDSVIKMTGPDIREHWNSTLGQMDSINITWKSGDPSESPVPGFGHITVVFALMAIICPTLILRRATRMYYPRR